jgi:homoserine O-acetyltransferase
MFTLLSSSVNDDKIEYHLLVQSRFPLESNVVFDEIEIAFQTWGKLNEAATNVVWVCHALTGNHRVQEWWDGLFGENKLFDPSKYFIVCVNTLGSAYGTTSAHSARIPEKYQGNDFPVITNKDTVGVFEFVRQYLGLARIEILIGASLGGQQAMEWGLNHPEIINKLILIATNAVHSPFGIAFNEAQRLAIEADVTFLSKDLEGGRKGLVAARAIGMLSYRTYQGYTMTQKETDHNRFDAFKAASYQRYQGEKLCKRFNAHAYWTLTKSMDSHNIFRGEQENRCQKYRAPVLVIGIDSDYLFPIHEQRYLADLFPNARLKVIHSDFGHDGFLVDYNQLHEYIDEFIVENDEK